MGFTEVTFLFIFLPAAIIIYLAVEKIFHNDTVNNIILVFFSFLFYLWSSKESFGLFMTIGLLLYFAGNAIGQGRQTRKIILLVILLVGLLVFFKYIVLVVNWINTLADIRIIRIGTVIAPIGISFVVFEGISYLVDIYRGDAKSGTLLE